MDTRTTSNTSTTLQPDFGFGIIAGILGGACLGFIMQFTGMMARYAHVVGAIQDIDGWFVLVVICAFLGAIYGAAAYQISKNWVVSGLVYGIIWWVIGSLFVLPILMGDSIFTFDAFVWWGLLGNLLFGVVTAGVFLMMSHGYGEFVTPQGHSL